MFTPNFLRAAETVVHNETGRRLALAAIALERYRLRHGQYPETLDALAPDCIAAVPKDPADGQSLRYRIRAEATPLLYGIGPDGTDEGGSWSGKWPSPDVVWPAPVGPREPQPAGPLRAAGAAGEREPPMDDGIETFTFPGGDERLERIEFKEAPLLAVLQSVAREAGLNYMLDPDVSVQHAQTQVSFRWENVSKREAWTRVLKVYGLRVDWDARTTIGRVTLASKPRWQHSSARASVPEPPEGNEHALEPALTIKFQDALLSEVVRTLARDSGANLIIEPKLAEWADKVWVSINFTNVSSWQVLNGLLNNHGVELVSEPGAKSLYRLRVWR